MSRLPFLTESDLDDERRGVWSILTGGRRGSAARLTNEQGGLIGPFNAMVTAPVVGGPMAALGEAIRFETGLDRKLQELAIITVGAHYRSNFEFWAHSNMALEAGLDESIVDALVAGTTPPFTDPNEEIVHTLAHSLVTTGRIADDAYAAAQTLLGDTGVVELVASIGYYGLVSMTLNAFAIEMPPGVEPIWPV